MFWIIGVVAGIGAAIAVLRWALRSHRAERRPWIHLLARSAVEGVADDGGAIPPSTAPFTGRPCLGYVIEIVVQEPYFNETTFYRAFTDGAGQLFLRGPHGGRTAWADLRGGRVVFPIPLEEYGKYSSSLTAETIFHGTMDRAPPHLVAFVTQLDPRVQELVFRPCQMIGGKRVYFNERIVVPGQPTVVAGPTEQGSAGVHVVPNDEMPVALALGTLAAERARVAKLPIASELFGAVMGGVVVCALVNMVLAMFVAK
jgi:hypothetical protein